MALASGATGVMAEDAQLPSDDDSSWASDDDIPLRYLRKRTVEEPNDPAPKRISLRPEPAIKRMADTEVAPPPKREKLVAAVLIELKEWLDQISQETCVRNTE